MKQGAPISPSFTISSEDVEDEDNGVDDAGDDDDDGGDDAGVDDDDDNDEHDDDDDDFDEEDDDDGCVLAATNLCLSHLAFTDEQRGGELDYI